MSHPLTRRRRGLWPRLRATIRGRSRQLSWHKSSPNLQWSPLFVVPSVILNNNHCKQTWKLGFTTCICLSCLVNTLHITTPVFSFVIPVCAAPAKLHIPPHQCIFKRTNGNNMVVGQNPGTFSLLQPMRFVWLRCVLGPMWGLLLFSWT